jgi:hypothetical protein
MNTTTGLPVRYKHRKEMYHVMSQHWELGPERDSISLLKQTDAGTFQ